MEPGAKVNLLVFSSCLTQLFCHSNRQQTNNTTKGINLFPPQVIPKKKKKSWCGTGWEDVIEM